MTRRLHPLTVLLRGVPRGLGLAGFGFTVGSVAGGASGASLLAIPLGLLGLAVGVGYEYARVKRFEYELTADTLDVRSGVLARREREIPYGRVQNVDVTRDVLGRILGLATVAVETAGGGETEARLRYVTLEDARYLQDGIRERTRAERVDADATPAASTTTSDATAAEAPSETNDGAVPGASAGTSETTAEQTGGTPADHEPVDAFGGAVDREVLFELDDWSLVLLSVLSFDARVLSLLFFVGPVGFQWLAGAANALGPRPGVVLAVLGVAVAVVLGVAFWLVGAVTTFARYYGFRLTRVGDELRYERGLVQRYDGSIPLDKVQRLTVEETVLMRRFGYAALAVETAGYAPGSTPSGGSEAAIPLAPRDRLFELAADIEPFEMPDIERPPARARRRYAVRYALAVLGVTGAAFAVDALVASVPWYLPLGLLVAVVPAARATWRHRGRALAADHVVTRTGFWRRRTHVVPYYRVQTVIERRTVFQRRWGLASVVVDTAGSRSLVGGDATAIDCDDAAARAFASAVADRFQAALLARRTGRRDRDEPAGDPANAD